MGLKQVTCPNCGKEVMIEDTKETNFCLQCGHKIVKDNHSESLSTNLNLEEKLEEAAFYYSLSRQKKEAADKEKNPVYYLKGQDLLVTLSNVFKTDYRIWWELSKPLDYMYEEEVNDGEGAYRFNDNYFDKALDFANIAEKKQIILERDQYEQKKSLIENNYKIEMEKQQRIQEQKEEENRKREAEEEQRIRAEQEKQRREEEAVRKANEEKRKLQEEELRKQMEYNNKTLLQKFSIGDCSMLDNSFFLLKTISGKEYICVLKLMSNILYLMVFYRDSVKMTMYLEQSVAVEVNKSGEMVKFGDKKLRIKDGISDQTTLRFSYDEAGRLRLNSWELSQDERYVLELIGHAKKPLVALDKIIG